MSAEADFAARFAAFSEEGRSIKASVLADLAPVLEQADKILSRLTDAGIPFRVELPMHVNARVQDIRVKARLEVSL